MNGLIGLGQQYNTQAGQALGTAANLQQDRRDFNRAAKAQQTQGRIGLVASGAGTGAAVGGPIGAGIGAGLGLLASFL